MRNTRIYIDSGLAEGMTVEINQGSHHHIVHVLKKRPGDVVHAFDGSGGYYQANIESIGKKTLVLKTDRFIDDSRESVLDLTLVQGISRGQKMDYTIQKAVELGVSRIFPVMSEFSNVKLDESRQEKRLLHWRGITIGACEQSGRNRLPALEKPISLYDWLEIRGDLQAFVLDPGGKSSLASSKPDEKRLALVCGPEGGLSDNELAYCGEKGCQLVSLGPRILRTETAGVAALVICQSQWGDLV